jgi:exopolysaccharide biosynthesis polyprenyl glycosylphosphotransferase
VGAWVTKWVTPEFGRLAFFWATAIALLVIARSIARGIVRRTSSYRQKTLIVGGDSTSQLLAQKLAERPESGIELVGYVTERQSGNGLPVLGTPRDLPSIVSRFQIDRVIVTELDESEAPVIIRSLRARDVQVDFVPRPLEAVGLSGSMHMLDGVPLLGVSPMRLSWSSRVVKRTIDILISGVGLVLLAPMVALIAILIKLDSRGPVMYRHERIGRNGRPFRLLKFRTMKTEHCRGADYGGQPAEEEFERLMRDPTIRAEFESNYKLQNDPRVTRFGAFLRRTSLDELPQLLNVLRGELSLVGPRPLVADELTRYEPDVGNLLALRPGMTGYWQISGRSANSYTERVRLDLAYASDWSLQLDLSILLHTLRVLVLSRRGAY